MKIEDFPIGFIPFEAMDRAMKLRKFDYTTGEWRIGLDQKYKPLTWNFDSKLGNMTAILYWYPEYIDKLYELAADGKDYVGWLNEFHRKNGEHFIFLFKEVAKKLDKILELKTNHLDEVYIEKGKLF